MALKVVGSNPIIHPIKRTDTFGYLFFLFQVVMGFENKIQMSGGHLFAAGLDGSNTLIFATGENANESHYPPLSQIKTIPQSASLTALFTQGNL